MFVFSPSEPKEKEKEAEWADEESDVAHLGDDDFDTYLASHPSVLVMFYAPCKYRLTTRKHLELKVNVSSLLDPRKWFILRGGVLN